MNKFKRGLLDASIGFNDAQINEHNEYAGAKKTLPLNGTLERIGDISAGHTEPKAGTTIALYNNSGTVAWFAMEKLSADLPATVDGTNGIAIPPNSYFYTSMAFNKAIKTSATTVIAYKVLDSTIVTPYKGFK